MKFSGLIVSFALTTVLLAAAPLASAQQAQSFKNRFFAHNYAMTKLQPNWPTPLVEADPRLTQYYRFAFSNEYTAAGTQTVNYGNARGGGIVALNRIQVDWLPPSYIQHNSTAADGFGDTAVLVKFRIASANAEHGNYILTAILNHTFASSPKNGAATDSWNPTLAGGIGFLRHFDVESSLGGAMPTGKIAQQGRTIAWNSLVHDHVSKHVFLELENNATFYFAGSHDGKMQNFVTPAAFYIFKHEEWKPTHPFLVFTGGMQIATSHFHTYNHNTIAEMRILF
ncbi:MAG: hypothetical protein WA802_09215 [Terracidiphilus sp.]